MEQVNILKKMAEYDFSAPINVTMIFEDSDDDSNACQTIFDDSPRKHTDRVCPTNTETITIKEESLRVEIKQNVNINISDEKEKTTGDNIINLDAVNNNNLQINSHLTHGSRKRKLCDTDNMIYNVKTIPDKYDKQKHDNQHNNSERHTNGTQNYIQTAYSEKPNYKCQQINQHEQVTDDVNGLLVNVSENLILIMDSYYRMNKQLQSIKDVNVRKKSQDAFLYIRRYFLDLSYETIDTLIVPHENNSQFVNSFLDSTVRIAINKKGINCNRQHVYTFYKYMVEWTKQHKKHTTSLQQQNTQLKEYLSRPPIQVNSLNRDTVANVDHYTLHNPCIYSSGPPGREITISVNTDTLNDVNTNNAFPTQACSSIQGIDEYCINYLTPENRTALKNTHNNLEFIYNQPPKQAVSRKKQPTLNILPQAVFHPPVSKPLPTPYSMRQPNSIQNKNHYVQTTMIPTQNPVDTTRLTESSESGYVSPSSVSPNLYTMDCVRNKEQTVVTPMISNIVSLGPRYSYTNMHGCHMCGKVTELRCRGCYTYYCSIICEQLDSQFHHTLCRRIM